MVSSTVEKKCVHPMLRVAAGESGKTHIAAAPRGALVFEPIGREAASGRGTL